MSDPHIKNLVKRWTVFFQTVYQKYKPHIKAFTPQAARYLIFLIGVFLIFLILSPSVTKLIAWIVTKSSDTGSTQLLEITLYIAAILCVVYLMHQRFIAKKNQNSWLERNQGFLVALTLIISIFLIFLQQTLTKFDELNKEIKTFIKFESILEFENARSSLSLANLEQDINNDPNTIVWNRFYTENYQQALSHIQTYYQSPCDQHYLGFIAGMTTLNTINEFRRSDTATNRVFQPPLSQNILDVVSSTESLLQKIQSDNCRSLMPVKIPDWYEPPNGVSVIHPKKEAD